MSFRYFVCWTQWDLMHPKMALLDVIGPNFSQMIFLGHHWSLTRRQLHLLLSRNIFMLESWVDQSLQVFPRFLANLITRGLERVLILASIESYGSVRIHEEVWRKSCYSPNQNLWSHIHRQTVSTLIWSRFNVLVFLWWSLSYGECLVG